MSKKEITVASIVLGIVSTIFLILWVTLAIFRPWIWSFPTYYIGLLMLIVIILYCIAVIERK